MGIRQIRALLFLVIGLFLITLWVINQSERRTESGVRFKTEIYRLQHSDINHQEVNNQLQTMEKPEVELRRRLERSEPAEVEQRRRLDRSEPAEVEQRRRLERSKPAEVEQRRRLDRSEPAEVEQRRRLDRSEPAEVEQRRRLDRLELEVEQKRRLERIEKVCHDVSSGRTENILMYKPKQLSYCVVPKNGCTFWIRMMRFLNNDTNSKIVSSPFDITRGEAHGWPLKQTLYRIQNHKHRDLIFNSTRFMVGRDPWSKLLSGYMDKMFLPNYWTYQGKMMIKRVRQNASINSLHCGHDLSFQEYLDYLLTERATPWNIEGHFRPVQHYCSPCIFKPHIVAKQETFQKDSEFILKKFGLYDIVKNYDHKAHVKDELNLLSGEYLGWADSTSVKNCMTRQDFLLRVWKIFQINGYLPLGSESDLDLNILSAKGHTAIKYIKDAIFEAYEKGQVNKKAMKQQRRRMMVEMYHNVSRSTREKIAEMFKTDFDLFGYDSHPSDLFSFKTDINLFDSHPMLGDLFS